MPGDTPKKKAGKLRLDCKKALDFSATASWCWDTATGEIALSDTWAEMLVTPPQKLGKSLEYICDRCRDTDREVFKKAFRELQSGKKNSLDLPVRIRRFDNTWAWVILRGQVEENGIFTGVCFEVSRLRLEKRFFPPSIDDSASSYQSILEHSPNNIVRFDRELFPLYANPAVSDFISCPREELGAKKLHETETSPSDLEFIQGYVEQVYASGEVAKVRRTVTTPSGNRVGDFTFWPEFDVKGKVRSVLCLQQDLTDEVAREREAYMNELRFSALYQLTQMNDAPEEDVLRFVVEKIAELTGSPYSHLYIPPDVLGAEPFIVWSESHRDIFTEEELAQFRVQDAVIPTGQSTEMLQQIFYDELSKESRSGFFSKRLPIFRSLCAPALESGRVMCLASVYNKKEDYLENDMRQLQTFITGALLIVRRRRYVHELKLAKDSAELANKVKDRFLANVSHELRTPLNGILSMLQLLELSDLDPQQADYARSATHTGQTLLRIISDILDFSKMESGRLELDHHPFDLKECLASVMSLFSVEAGQRGIGLKLSLAGTFPYMVNGDEARVRQILFNLVGNALKFTDEGEVEVFCEAREAGEDKVTIHLSVRDTGIGIPPEMQAQVFEAFMQVDSSSTRKYQGSGLGLGIVRQLTHIMGGSINLKSFLGRGTLVECVLPFHTVPKNLVEPEGYVPVVEDDTASGPALTVLVAEDDAVSRMSMRLFLERLGHRAACVTNGREALEALRLHPFDCLISDVLMPELDGIEVTRHIREGLADTFRPSSSVVTMVGAAIAQEDMASPLLLVPRDLPIIAVSAHAMRGDKEHFLRQGMDHYISKPVTIKELEATLRRATAKKSAALSS